MLRQPDPEPWWTQIACAGRTEVFFAENLAAARSICRDCRVRVSCLIEDLLIDEDRPEHGIRAGFGPVQRDRLAKKVQEGADPLEVAHEAINAETLRRRGGATPGKKPRFKRQ